MSALTVAGGSSAANAARVRPEIRAARCATPTNSRRVVGACRSAICRWADAHIIRA